MGDEHNFRCMMMMPNKQIILKNYIQGCPKESDFQVRRTAICSEIPQGSEKAVLLKNLYLACDPFICHLMRPERESLIGHLHNCIIPGSVVMGYGVAKVIKSGYEELKEGDYVWGKTGWEDFSWNFDPQKLLTKISNTNVPLSYYASVLGMPGLSAYVGFHEICSPKQGETVYVSSAASGVGHLVGQFAKMMGCYVVGSASTQQKVDLLKTKLGFDDAFNYKEGNLRSKLNEYFPKGIDIYFENVGGEMLDEVLLQMKSHGRIAVSGMISQYNLDEHQGIHNLFSLTRKRLTLKGFVELDYKETYPEYLEWALNKLQKKLTCIEELIPGLENGASAYVGIFHGHNIGKRIIVVDHEDD